MKTFVVLLALAAVAVASPVGKENVQQESLVDNEADLAKIKGSAGIKCRGKKCEVHVGIGGSWYVADDGTLVPVLEAEPAGGHVDVGAECRGSRCGGSIKVGVDWLKSEDGNIVAEPAKTGSGLEIRCREKHCIWTIDGKKMSQSSMEEADDPEVAKRRVEIGAECRGSKCSGSIKVGVDWFKAEDGSLVGVPRPEEAKIRVGGGIKCRGKRCSGHVKIGGSWYVAGDEALVPVPQPDVAAFGGRVEVGGRCEGSNCEGNLGVRVNWFEAEDGSLIPMVTPTPAGGHVDVGADCKGSKCGGSINVGVEWFVTSKGTIVLVPTPAKTHITGGIECHGKRCSGNIGVGVDWFKDEDGNVSPVIVPIPRPTEEDSVTGDNYRYRGGKIPTVPIIPKDMPRLIKPKSYNAEEEDKEPAYVQKDVVLGNGNEPVEMVFDSDCNEAEADDMRCNDVTLGIQWYKLPSGEIVSQFTEDENTSIEQVGPTTARVKWNGKGRVVCRKGKCHVEISGGVRNRRRRDLGNDAVEINKTFLTLKEKDLPLDMVLHFARYD